MKRVASLLCALILFVTVLAPPAEAASTRVIVRVNGGLPVIQTICVLLRCTVNYGLGDPAGQVFLVTTASLLRGIREVIVILRFFRPTCSQGTPEYRCTARESATEVR